MVDQAQQVRKTTEYSYRRGEATLVEFLDAQRAFNDTMQTYNEARADYARSLYLLDSLAGAATSFGVDSMKVSSLSIVLIAAALVGCGDKEGRSHRGKDPDRENKSGRSRLSAGFTKVREIKVERRRDSGSSI